MVEVARLESGFKHYLNEDGTRVLKGHVTPADTGLMQINCTHWCDDAARLGLDLTNIVDNVEMARYVYDTQGITAWVAFTKHMAQR